LFWAFALLLSLSAMMLADIPWPWRLAALLAVVWVGY
jgi:hypothetical protein